MVRYARDAQRLAELAPLAAGGLAHGLLEADVVAVEEGGLDGGHVVEVPVVTDQAGDEELAAEGIALGGRQGVVQEQGIPDRLVDDAVEDVG